MAEEAGKKSLDEIQMELAERTASDVRRRISLAFAIGLTGVFTWAAGPVFGSYFRRFYDTLVDINSLFTFSGAIFVAAAAYVGLRVFLDYGSIFRTQEYRVTWPGVNVIPATLVEPPSSPTQPTEVEPTAKLDCSQLALEMRQRLTREIRDQGVKANTNLAGGVILAMVAVGFLVWLAFEQAVWLQTGGRVYLNPKEPQVALPPMLYWGAFAAKVSLAITANVFSFFFLSTYRRNLSEIKYFQNELTNVESKLLALAVVNGGTPKNTPDVIKSLLAVERNFILKKGETTADISLKQMDSAELGALAELVAKVSSISEAVSRKKKANGTATA